MITFQRRYAPAPVLLLWLALIVTPINAHAQPETRPVAPDLSPRAPSPPAPEKPLRICGWYAISFCSEDAGQAEQATNQHGGYVIDTSSGSFPNFRAGWFCAVDGPSSRAEALAAVEALRRQGAASPYAKSSC